MPEAKSVVLRKKRRVTRISKLSSAKTCIRGFDHEHDVIGLTFGQFSLLDLLQAALDVTGPADVTVSMWSAGLYDVDAAKNFMEDGRIRSIRFVMDNGREKSGQAGVVNIADLFGVESIRTTRTHAKFVLVLNDEWHVLITSSMNLNKNIRFEQFTLTDDEDVAKVFDDYVSELFKEVDPGSNPNRAMPMLEGLGETRDEWSIRINTSPRMGTALPR